MTEKSEAESLGENREGAALRSANQQQEPELHRVRPILFSSDMVRAILDGRKTQTRRVDEMRGADRVYWHVGETHAWKGKPPEHYEGWVAEVSTLNGLLLPLRCPFGAVSDRLWVRETWNVQRVGVGKAAIGYRAGGDLIRALGNNLAPTPDEPPSFGAERRWRSPIHMPYWASRITLEITGVRVERVQDISTHDIGAEGINLSNNHYGARNEYRDLWDSLNEKRGYSWASNPWVWVIEFRPISESAADFLNQTGEKS